jgi:hypothetical protein
MRQVHHGQVESALLMDLLAEATRGNKRVHVLDGRLQKTPITPPLWRTFMGQGTGKTMGLQARSRIEPEEDMHGTDQPVLVHGIELEAPSVFQNFRAE